MNKSDDIKDLAGALCKAQSEMGGASKDANNPFFKSKYADLSSVIRAVKQPFADNGLSYSQLPISKDGLVGVTTILMHNSGQWLSSDLLLKPTKGDPQAAGSCLTYCRRYSLQSLAGIPSEDDDGNAASAAPKQANSQTSKLSASPGVIGGNPCSRSRLFDDNTKTWIAIVKAEPSRLSELSDVDYRAFIKEQAGV